jgi:hypothetical protein
LFAVHGSSGSVSVQIITDLDREARKHTDLEVEQCLSYFKDICEVFLLRTPLATTFVAAGEELGYMNRDGNGEYQTGFMIAQVNTCHFLAPSYS